MNIRIDGHWFMMYLISITILGLFMFLSCYESDGAIITVDGNGNGEYLTIQDAIDNSTDFDTIRVFNGAYEEYLYINNSITIIGNGSDSTIIRTVGDVHGISILANDVVLKDVSVVCSHMAIGYSGIFIASNDVTISNVTVGNHHKGIQTKAYIRGLHIVNCTIMNNFGSGLMLSSASDCTIEYNEISGSGAVGLYLWDSTRIRVAFNQLHHCIGVGLLIYQSHNNTIFGNDIFNNSVGVRVMSGDSDRFNASKDNNLQYNNIKDNLNEGMNATRNPGILVDARYNYWGNGSGPYHERTNGNGNGDRITDGILFNPWLDSEGNAVDFPSDRKRDEGFLPSPHIVLVMGCLCLTHVLKRRERRRTSDVLVQHPLFRDYSGVLL